jgi:hypothetical protein
MATIGFQLAYGNPHVVHLPEHGTSSSFTPGDLVAVAGGKVQLIADGTSTSQVFGVALKGYTGTTNSSIPVHVISPEDIFIAQMETTSTTTDIGQDLGVITTAGSQVVDTDSATGVVSVIDFFEPVGTGDKVLVKFIPAILQGSGYST